MSRALGLDLGSTWGYCLRDLITGEVTHGEEDHSGVRPPGARVAAFGNWLRGILQEARRPREEGGEKTRVVVGHEKIEHIQSSGHALIFYGQRGVLIYLAQSLDLWGVNIQHLKQSGAGAGNATKAEMVEAAKGQLQTWGAQVPRELGDNEADAILACAWVIHHAELDPERRH